MENLTQELLKDIFSDLTDEDWFIRIGDDIWYCDANGIVETGKTLNQAIKQFSKKVSSPSDIVECYKISTINLSKDQYSVLNFKEFKETNLSLISRVPVLCDYLEIEEEDVRIESNYSGGYSISFTSDTKKVKNLKKFTIIQSIFNTKFNGLISIGLVDSDIKLNIPSDARGINIEGWYAKKKEALDMIEKDFNIIEKDFSIYLQPKFEFIIDE
jgi:hypothetical protein